MGTGGVVGKRVGGLGRVQPVRGRRERAALTKTGAPVYVDYAHTPDGLRAALEALRPPAGERLIMVFGAGGDRDKGKRQEMGRVAADLADRVIVPADKPPPEDACASRADIPAGHPARVGTGGRASA